MKGIIRRALAELSERMKAVPSYDRSGPMIRTILSWGDNGLIVALSGGKQWMLTINEVEEIEDEKAKSSS